MRLKKHETDLVLAAHFLFGWAAGLFPNVVFYWVISAFLAGLYYSWERPNGISAFVIASYLTGIELLARMSASGLPHEFIKYAVIGILVVQFVRQPKRVANEFVVFILLLIPAILLADGGSIEETRQLVSANLSGPVCLAVSSIFFYNRVLDVGTVRKIFLSILYPLAATVGYLVIRTPDFNEIEFGFQSNFVTSIYGPNQMSSILGLGILIIGLAYFLSVQLFGSHLVSLVFFCMLLFRGLLTFSRGGMITPAILLSIIFVYFAWKLKGLSLQSIRILWTGFIVTVVAVVAFSFTNKLTGNALLGRYTGVKDGRQIENIDRLTSGRTLIMYLDWEIFKQNPVLGAGVGMGKFVRKEFGYDVEVAAHNEFSRILAEHGLFGIGVLMILIFAPIFRFFSDRNLFEKALIIALVGFCFVFMTHAATRLAAPCFLFGLAFIKVVPSIQRLKNHGLISRKYVVKARQVAGTYGNTSNQIR